MTITLRQIAELILKEISGGTPTVDSQFTERQVILKVRSQINESLQVQVLTKKMSGDAGVPRSFVYTYPPTAVDKSGNSQYATFDLPDIPIDLPFEMGIYEVCPEEDPYSPIPRRLNHGVTKHTFANRYEGSPGWFNEGKKVVIYPKDKVGKNIIPKLVGGAPELIGINDTLPITPEMIPQVVAKVKSELLNEPLHDQVNDENPDLGVKIDR